jgi:hypothetical protein
MNIFKFTCLIGVVFVVIISLITGILTIPIVLVLEFILENYANSWPEKKGFNTDTDTDKILRKTRLELREAENKSMFGEVISKAMKEGNAHDSYSSTDLAQITYAGGSYLYCYHHHHYYYHHYHHYYYYHLHKRSSSLSFSSSLSLSSSLSTLSSSLSTFSSSSSLSSTLSSS